MARRRSEDREGLPKNLYVNGAGYFWYKDRNNGKTRGLGRDRDEAIRVANKMNESMGIFPEDASFGRQRHISKLLPEAYLADSSKAIGVVCGIYFLIREKRVVYVGKSTNIHWRIGNHLVDKKKRFDAYNIVECKPEYLDELEAMYIAKFIPEFNIAAPKVRGTLLRDLALGIAEAA